MKSFAKVRLQTAHWALSATVCATLLVACGGDGESQDAADTSTDSVDVADSVEDTTTDTAGSDTGLPDTAEVADTAVADLEQDTTEADTEPDIAPDTTSDIALDVEPDTAPDTTPDVAPDIAVDTAPEIIDPGPPPAVTINEYDCHSEWVEVVVTGTESVDLAGLFLTDDVDNAGHRVPLTGTLAPGGFLAVDLDFGLACGTEGVFIVRGVDEVIAEAPAGDSPGLLTRGRLPDVTGAFALTAPTRQAANKAAPFDPRDPGANLFDPFRPIATIDITMPQSSIDLIWQDPYRYVPASFKWTEGDGSGAVLGDLNVAVRLKGKLGSYRDLNGKSAFKLDFDRFWPGATFHGLKGITLNNMVQDWTRIHEVLAYDLFRKMGVPAPRATYAEVRVNGARYGLYLVLETLDGDWRDRNFDSTLGMVEGEYGEDFFPGTAYNFDLDGGSEAAYLALDNLIQRIADAPREGFMAALADVIAWDEVLAMMT
ncbi:MAG: CotH kinase family protein, partial [Deltaproteobacteria bacterium]|nr:CotH kinase family protein [Deltaproteobacteria bacterium]